MTTLLPVPGASSAPELSPGAAQERAARAGTAPHREPERDPAPAAPAAPAGTGGGQGERQAPGEFPPPGNPQERPGERPRDRGPGRERIRGRGPFRAPLAVSGLLVSLAANAALGAYLLVPRWGPFARLHLGPLQLLAPAAALGAVITAAAAYRGARRALAGRRSEDVLTALAAVVATTVATSGMWVFFTTKVHMPIWLRPETSSIFEIAAFGLAMMARRHVKREAEKARREGREPEPGTGPDGVAMWAVVAASGVLSAMAADNFPEAVFRLIPPLLTAYLFERLLVAEQFRTAGRARNAVTLKFSPRRLLAWLLVRLGWAEPAGRTLGQAAASRYVTAWAEAVEREIEAAESGGRWRRRRAARRYRAARRKALEQTEFWRDSQVQQELLVKTRVLCTTSAEIASAATEAVAAPWQGLLGEQDTNRQRPDDPADIAESLYAGQRDARKIHWLLADRDRDAYAAVAEHLGTEPVQHGARRLAAFAALYAEPGAIERNSSGLAAAWLAEHFPLPVDGGQIRENRRFIRGVWEVKSYGPFAAPAGLRVA